jgi:hypothetical protein
MDPITQTKLDASAQHMADGLKIMNPDAVKILQKEAYLLGYQDGLAKHDARAQDIIDSKSRLIERLTAKMNVLSNENRQLKTTIREVNPNEE